MLGCEGKKMKKKDFTDWFMRFRVPIAFVCVLALILIFYTAGSVHGHIDAAMNVVDSEAMCVAAGLDWDFNACLLNYVDGVRSCSKVKDVAVKVYSVEPPSLVEKIEMFVLFGVRFESCGSN